MNVLTGSLALLGLLTGPFLYSDEVYSSVFSLRGGDAKITGDIESSTATVSGFSMNAIGPEMSSWFLGLRIQLGLDFVSGNFDYKGTNFPFESEKETAFTVFSFSPGLTFFSNTPIQLQLGLPMGSLEIAQKSKYKQRYASSGYLVRIGHLVSNNLAISAEYEIHRVESIIDSKRYGIDFRIITASIGWAFGDK